MKLKIRENEWNKDGTKTGQRKVWLSKKGGKKRVMWQRKRGSDKLEKTCKLGHTKKREDKTKNQLQLKVKGT